MHNWLPNLVAKFWLLNLVLYQTDDESELNKTSRNLALHALPNCFSSTFVPDLEANSVVPELTTRDEEHCWWSLLKCVRRGLIDYNSTLVEVKVSGRMSLNLPASAPRMCEHTRGSGAEMSKSACLHPATAPRICERSFRLRGLASPSTWGQGPVLLLRHDAVARILANGSAAFIESCLAIGWNSCDSIRSL